MTTKLTLTIDDSVIAIAKKYAKQNGKSLSDIVENYLLSLSSKGKTEENIKQVESLRREIAPHIRFLKKQVEKIEKAVEMKTDLTKMYHEYFCREE